MSDTTYLNKVKPESGKTVEFEGADILARNVRITETPSEDDMLITKQYFESNRSVSNINTMLGYSNYEIQNNDLANYSQFIIYADPRTGNQIYKLPSLDQNQGKIIRVQASALGGKVTIQGQSGEKIGGYSSLALQSRNDYLDVIAGIEWEILGYHAVYDTGYINTNDWTNRHLGTSAFDYDTLTGTFTVGELITESTSSNTGIIQSDTGSLIYVKNVTGTGIWTNNRTITGSTSGATALVNEVSGSNKNQDTYVFHDFGIDVPYLKVTNLMSPNIQGTDSDAIVLPDNARGDYFGHLYNGETRNIDSFNIKHHAAGYGFFISSSVGLFWQITSQDYSYKTIIEVKI